jgi:MFS family permease
MLTGIGPDTSLMWLIAAYVLFGVGFGFVNAPITNAAVSGMPADQAGVAAAVASTSRLVGISLGVAIIGSIVVSSSDENGASIAAASHPGWWICVACGLAVIVMAFLSTTERARNSARLVEAATA